MNANFARAALLSVGLVLLGGPAAIAADPNAAAMPRLITVSGEGEATAVPDRANFRPASSRKAQRRPRRSPPIRAR